jgi:circadian clock protein KaiC
MIVDPITSFTAIGGAVDVKAMMARVIDYAKQLGITTLLTDLLKEGRVPAPGEMVTSLMDTWITLQRLEANGENNRVLYVMKSRGMSHSNQIREFVITDDGIKLVRPYIGPGGVLTGTARYVQEAKDHAEAVNASLELDGLSKEMARLKGNQKAEVADVKANFELKENELTKRISQLQAKLKQADEDQVEMKRSRNGHRKVMSG